VLRGTYLTVPASHFDKLSTKSRHVQQQSRQTIQGHPVGLTMRKDQKDCDLAFVQLASCHLSFVICHYHDEKYLSRWCTRGMNSLKCPLFASSLDSNITNFPTPTLPPTQLDCSIRPTPTSALQLSTQLDCRIRSAPTCPWMLLHCFS